MSARWMIVRRSRTIPGGFRVVRWGLSETEAREWASRYQRPHEAMSEEELVGRRMVALEESRSASDSWSES